LPKNAETMMRFATVSAAVAMNVARYPGFSPVDRDPVPDTGRDLGSVMIAMIDATRATPSANVPRVAMDPPEKPAA
jgi:hypothetical protein